MGALIPKGWRDLRPRPSGSLGVSWSPWSGASLLPGVAGG